MNATLAGFAAIVMWSLLALLTNASGEVPPFQLLAMTFATGSAVGVAMWLIRRPDFRALAGLSPIVWLTGIAGLFGYHFFYYTALRNAPVAEASLIAYLWPLLIVLFSALLPGERLRSYHLAGAVMGFAGAAILIMSGSDEIAGEGAAFGYFAAFLCAFIWSAYSVISRALRHVTTDAVVLYCIATAILATLCHLSLEATVWPQNTGQWLAVAGLGLMPVGLAFYAWDHAMKHGPIQLIGSAAYGAPVLSTIFLVLAGTAEPGWPLASAALLVTLGALVASGRLVRKVSHA